MPVHPAGPRLFSSIPFKHLAQHGGGSSRDTDVHLNITPFVDMMTILVTFLLMVFSASGEILMAQKGLTLPDAENDRMLRQAPILIVSKQAITFNQKVLADPRLIDKEQKVGKIIEQLHKGLLKESDKFDVEKLPKKEQEYCKNKAKYINKKTGMPDSDKTCLEGLLILQADKQITAKVLNRVLFTARQAKYNNIMFAVNQNRRK